MGVGWTGAMRRLAPRIGVAALALTGAVGIAALLAYQTPDPLLGAEPGLRAIGARLEKVTITAWAPLPEGKLPGDLAASVARALGAEAMEDSLASTSPGHGAERRVYSLREWPGARLTLTLRNEHPAAVSALLTAPAPAARWWSWRSRLRTALQEGSTAPRVYTVLEYAGDGDRLWSSRREVVAGILRLLSARVVEGVDDAGLYSVTAYSPRLPERLQVAGRPVNANVALHWDSQRGKTLLWLGSPVINVEY